MTETVAYIRDSLKELYSPGETRALVRLILERVCGMTTSQLLLGKDTDLSDTERERIKEIVRGLRAYEPIQYLLGVADFDGLELKVTPDTLIPRPETAELVALVAADHQGSAPRLLDIGTGSGCIAIALAKRLPEAELTAIDISPGALAVAEENAHRNGARIRFERFDILSGEKPRFLHEQPTSRSPGNGILATSESRLGNEQKNIANEPIFSGNQLDAIVSNPPYVMEREKADMEPNVLRHEPGGALFVPDDNPLLFYQAIARFGKEHLRPGGRLYFEINALLGRETRELLEGEHYKNVELIRDLYGRDRFIKATI